MVRENLVQNMEQWKNPEQNKEWVINNLKKAASALALTVVLWANPANAKIVNDLKSYEDACLNSVAWEKVTILVSEEFYRKHRTKILKSIPEEDMCELKWYNKKTNSASFPVVEKKWKKYFQISFKATEYTTDASDIVAQKEQQVAQKEQQVAQKEQQVKELEKMVKAKWYLWYLQDKTIEILKNTENETVVSSILDEILKTLKIWNLKWNKYWEKIKKWLVLVKGYYKDKNENIVNKIDRLLKKLNLD